MKTTLEIPDKRMDALMKSGEFNSKKEAVNTAIEGYLHHLRVAKLLSAAGSMDDFLTTEELTQYRKNG